jgi:two-component system nitrate/nitrite response regulator NarL
VSKIELSLRSRLVRDTLSAVLSAAEFLVLDGPDSDNRDTIVIIDRDDPRDPETVRAHQARGLKIVLLASDADRLELNDLQIAPLSGVLTYDLSADTLVQCLRLICSGERVFPRDVVLERNSIAQLSSTKPQSDGVRLSPREREVLLRVVEGHPNKVIAWQLHIAEATVKVHLKSLQRKIRVSNRTQAAIWALANLPELDPTPRGFV